MLNWQTSVSKVERRRKVQRAYRAVVRKMGGNPSGIEDSLRDEVRARWIGEMAVYAKLPGG